ncbi:anthrax toxin-like adenylyl cyclase domain-containing protein [Terrarubrum flagellatum]|uniref:anthrax toxin-like adenylyl cyclase domain-containing protein n=1 Tax=Terrirubrum flagellatum TaxID=2895980 RepID=UPI003145680A
MLRGSHAILATGMPLSHGKVFQEVANQTKCVISSRAVGKWATGLLLESYATKGFHNKAKSCPWGPMAGFVMADPRFTKNPDIAGQRTDLFKTVKDGGSEIPLYITDERRKDLEGPLKRMIRSGGNINEMQYSAQGPTGQTMNFVLRREFEAPGARGKQLWAVFYGASEVRLSNSLTAPNRGRASNLLPVMAMVDPACPKDVKATYRAATTGDYDLFAIFPQRENYDRKGADERMVPGSDRFRIGIRSYIQHEDRHRGNLTPRIANIRYRLNNGVGSIGYTGGDVVHHSDEAGRPMISNIDFPFIAFVPGQTEAYCVENTGDFKRFIGGLTARYVVSLNAGWHREMGVSVSHQGHYEV